MDYNSCWRRTAAPPEEGRRTMKEMVSPKGLLYWCWSQCGSRRWGIFLLAALSVIQALLGLVLPLIFRAVVDGAVEGQGSVFTVNILIYGAMFLLLTGVEALGYHFSTRITFQMEAEMRANIFQGLLRTEYSELNKRSTGELQNHLNSDVTILVGGLTALPAALLFMFIRVAGASVILIAWDWRFFLLFLMMVFVLLLGALIVRRPLQKLHKQVQDESDQVQTVQQDALRNTLTLQSFFAYKSAASAWKGRVDGLRRAVYRQNLFSNLLHIGYALATDLGYLGCLLWYGMGVVGGAVTYGTLAGALQLVSQVQSPFSNLTQIISRYTSMRASAQRLRDLNQMAKDPVEEAPDIEGLPWLQRIELDHISFSYGQVKVLEDVSLSINRGDFIAFVGASGTGKSTLLRLLLSLYRPTDGSVRLFDVEGRSVPMTPILRRLFAYVPQGNFMMAGTIYQVVSFHYHQDKFTKAEEMRVRHACAVACADSFISQLPDKYETVIREGGVGLSEGQVQRLAIARAIYYRAPVLLLDEATSALDEATERQVLANIRELEDRTVLIVTHNPQALEVCGRVVRVENTKLYEVEKLGGN